jgi:hypothetical protein
MLFEEKVTYELGYAFGKSSPYVKTHLITHGYVVFFTKRGLRRLG